MLEADADDKIAAAFGMPTEGGDLATQGPRSGAIIERVVTAQAVAVPRDDAKILQKIKALATAAGEDWFYRFPVRDHGSTKHIEGPTIKAANNVARLYGNCEIDTRVLDNGNGWIIYARFIDWETGFSMVRPFEQSKSQQTIKTPDQARQQSNALQIGVSKAIRNVICNALEQFTTFAFEEARKNLVEKVGNKLPEYRERVLAALKDMKVEQKRVEASLGRPAKDWLADDVAKVIAEIQSVKDGMATVDETWPPEAPPRPTREQFREGAEVPKPAEQARPKAEFTTVDLDGQVETHGFTAGAFAAMREILVEASRRGNGALEGAWESNAGLLQQLREGGAGDVAEQLERLYREAPRKGKDSAKAEAATAAEPAEPPSPLKVRRAEWPPRVQWLMQTMRGMGPEERAIYLEKEPDFAFIRGNRTGDWERIKQLNDELADDERG
jgi:hypothetical protein